MIVSNADVDQVNPLCLRDVLSTLTKFTRVLSEPDILLYILPSVEAVARGLIVADIDALVPDLQPVINPSTIMQRPVVLASEKIGCFARCLPGTTDEVLWLRDPLPFSLFQSAGIEYRAVKRPAIDFRRDLPRWERVFVLLVEMLFTREVWVVELFQVLGYLLLSNSWARVVNFLPDFVEGFLLSFLPGPFSGFFLPGTWSLTMFMT